jgi:hypothetical protein
MFARKEHIATRSRSGKVAIAKAGSARSVGTS